MNPLIQTIYEAVIDGENDLAKNAVNDALSAGLPAAEILNQGLIAAMSEVGKRFENGDYFVPEMLIAARAMQNGLNLIKPFLQAEKVAATGKVVIGTVKGDLHDIGKNLVAMMLEGAGFQVIDLGTDVTATTFVETALRENVDILAMSALLTTTMNGMKSTIEALREKDGAHKVKVMVGGAPVTEEFAQKIGADGYAPDASRAAALAKSLLA
jgi:5-methyltetrahydrofolate--homocysteine methyltransferase